MIRMTENIFKPTVVIGVSKTTYSLDKSDMIALNKRKSAKVPS